MKMMTKTMICLASLAVISGCTTQTAQTPMVQSAEVARAKTPQQQLVYAAGLTNVPGTIAQQRNTEVGTASGAGMAVTGALNGVGSLGNLAAGGLGLLTFLTSPPAGPESWDHVIVKLPASGQNDPKVLQQARAIQDSLFSPHQAAFSAQGYTAHPATLLPGLVYYSKPGCTTKRNGNYDLSCAYALEVQLNPKGRIGNETVYLMTLGETAPVLGIRQNGLNADILRRVVDAFPNVASLYVAPRKVGDAWTPPMLYQRGKPLPL